MKRTSVAVFSGIIGLYGCGGNTDSGKVLGNTALIIDESPTSGLRSGQFLDGSVSNLQYRTETTQGRTDENGLFYYDVQENITFSIGDVTFATVAAKSVITPFDLAGSLDYNNTQLRNIVRLLVSIDEDGNPDNGISINDAAIENASEIDFSMTEAAFETHPAVTNLIANSGSVHSSLVSSDAAIAHFATTVAQQVNRRETINADSEAAEGSDARPVFEAVLGADAVLDQSTSTCNEEISTLGTQLTQVVDDDLGKNVFQFSVNLE